MTALVAILAALAVYRLTLLVVADVITEPIRDRLVERWTKVEHRLLTHRVEPSDEWSAWGCECEETWVSTPTDTLGGRYHWQRHLETAPKERESKLAYLITCPYCASVWVAFPVVASAIWWGNGWGWLWAAGSLAASGVASFLAEYASPE